MCKRAWRTPGTAEREASVADLLASEARHDPPTDRVRSAADDLANSLFPGDRFGESHAGLGDSLKLYTIDIR